MVWKEIPLPITIEPFCVASRTESRPANVRFPPGGPLVIPSTPTSPNLVVPPFAVEIEGSEMNCKFWNLKTARLLISKTAGLGVSMQLGVSNVVDAAIDQRELLPIVWLMRQL